MLFLGVDFETTGLSMENDRITEVGAVLWDTDRKAPLKVLSQYVYDKDYPELTPEITQLTGITQGDLLKYGRLPGQVLPELISLMDEADFVVAHNGTNFDRPMLEAHMQRLGIMYKDDVAWIDSSTDVNYPKSISVRKLSYLATEHGFLNPFPHRALFDVMTMLKIISCYDTNEIVNLSKSPNITIRAHVSYDDRALASGRGYRWNPENKMWLKTVKELFLASEIAEAPFKVIIIEER